MNVGTEDTIKENKNVDQSYMGSGPLSYTTPFTAVVPSFLSTPLLLLFLVVQPYTVMPNHTLHGPDCLVTGFYIVLWISSCLTQHVGVVPSRLSTRQRRPRVLQHVGTEMITPACLATRRR